ncbi:MAG: hypothetical protein DWB56_14865 [Candidatus Jettenia sp.]|uniref:Peptidase n=1 Tax=Candidatus Jettenia caeni TaxID=247490 RepID=I3ILR3_9BACT|nr:hypothetical protein [Candidatus Jettenia sp. AMX1]KAA0243574.1 MAG: hypothetical protein EDM70_09980 [Candidatus Brocadia sp. AMX2]MBC6930214.1 hypothetical protein [Candidatus Jettenia sp.]GAB62658.1 conserved hypothetical protein [Candidatus Jettenia caeni]MCQ3927088.1 hypothetical protein [Candidatus Jettenia sp.]MDL1939888.1 hypothetical protein [Candidatus Jettenia sp. AMX1]
MTNTIMTNTIPWIPIFKTGTHTSASGVTREWTEKDLDTIVAKYNPAEYEAPHVIGHPEHDSPAWGWVEALKREGQVLYAQSKDFVPEFVEMVRKGLFRKRSIKLNPDLSLVHIGWLGANPPAVRGLANVAFQEKEKEGVTIEFEEGNPPCPPLEKGGIDQREKGGIDQNRKEARSMKFFEWMKKKAKDEGVEIEDIPQNPSPSFSDADLRKLEIETEVQKRVQAKEQEFSEAQKKKDAELKSREDALKAQEAEAQKRHISSFCEGLLKEGKLTPAQMKYGMGIQTFMEKISTVQDTIEFAEGDKKVKQTPLEYFRSFLSSFKKQIEFSEVAGSDKDITAGGNAGEKLATLTQQKMKDNKNLSYSQAFSEAQVENPALAREYALEIGG